MAGGKFCPKCGFSNPPQRGACLMCYARLDQVGGGRQCPHCNHEVAAAAHFCASCGGTITEGMIAVPAPLAMATLLMAAGDDVFGGGGGGYHEPAAVGAQHYADDFAPVGDDSVPEIPLGSTPELPPLEHLAPAAAPLRSGPAAVEAEEEEMFVPPPPGLVTPAPPPPPEHEAFAPPPPPPLEDDAFAPPPAPPDLMDLSEEPAAPAPAPAAAPVAEAAKPAGEDFDFGDWALETPPEEEKKE